MPVPLPVSLAARPASVCPPPAKRIANQGGDSHSCRRTQSSKSLTCSTSAATRFYHLLRTGQLRSIKIGKLRRITEDHLAEFIASLEDQAPV